VKPLHLNIKISYANEGTVGEANSTLCPHEELAKGQTDRFR